MEVSKDPTSSLRFFEVTFATQIFTYSQRKHSMPGPFVHRIDPVIGEIAGLYFWWYGFSYTIGFLGIHFWLRRVKARLKLTLLEVYDLSIYLIVGVLLGGRLIELVLYEWSYYKDHLLQIPAFWLGGMSSHGLLLGAAVSTWLFCRSRGKSFLPVVDELVIPGAWVMGTGRIGNFIDGQIVGAETDLWLGVRFPDAPGFRHPVVLYDGLKNLLLIPLLLLIRRSRPPTGVIFAQFLFWYAFLRLFLDIFREYRVSFFEIGTGQIINIIMSLTGIGLWRWYKRYRGAGTCREVGQARQEQLYGGLWRRRCVVAVLLVFCLTIPSDWTQDVPVRYGSRHPDLKHSFLYPSIAPGSIGDN